MHMNGINSQLIIKTVVNNKFLIEFYFIVAYIVTYQQINYFTKNTIISVSLVKS